MKRLLCAFVCLGAFGCALDPVSGTPKVVFVSEEQEVEAGDKAAAELEAELGIVGDPGLNAYVEAVGQRVAAQAPSRSYSYRFRVIDDEIPNAFALPAGHIYVSRGLLTITNDEAELANVMAHEIAHVALRHHARRQARAIGMGILTLPGLLVGGLIPGPLGDMLSAPFAVAGMGAMASYSREQEREADRVGQQLAADAGYDPSAMARFLVTMGRDSKLAGKEQRELGFFAAHPATPSRWVDAIHESEKIEWTFREGLTSSRLEFLFEFEGMLIGRNPADGIFRGQRFLHPDMRFTLAFPEEWKTFNSRRSVGALSADGTAQLMLELAARGDDPRVAASAFIQEAQQRVDLVIARIESRRINGLSALRAQAIADTKRGRLPLDLTWVELDGSIFLISGLVSDEYTDAHRALFDSVADSFRALTSQERESIRITEIAVRQAEAGESLESFGRRTGNSWDVTRTAVANALESDATLAAGDVLKIAIERDYP